MVAPDTKIATENGPVRAASLEVGDKLATGVTVTNSEFDEGLKFMMVRISVDGDNYVTESEVAIVEGEVFKTTLIKQY